ncbi:response regulator [Tahibacter amnicola]|uniref:histidine kinase n=1 Tax=Tahibacter amnicola TaxID=2976241 RepID=A0ABY6BAH7_9GAMM|nr:response regulator [Tahibacter amnicola]UXI66526.1 response regulator [Tahibacter amnicola]
MTVNEDKVNILLVDDQPARLLAYEAILEELGENLVSARSGEEALKRLMEAEFGVIVLDVSMPGMDGFETAELIHQHPRFESTPIIFVTGVHIDELDRLQGYRLGAIDYVQVPVIPDILRSKIAVLVELYRKRRELKALNQALAGENASLTQANMALQAERLLEFQQLSETLAAANAELYAANQLLEAEVAERRRAQETSLSLTEKLRETDRRKDEFLATLAHELRNPLAPIRNALSLLQLSRAEPTATRHAAEVIDRQLRQLVRLVDDLLDVSRITRDKIDLRRERIDLTTTLTAAVEMVVPQMDAMNHQLSVEVPDSPIYVDGDAQRLAQVFGNLLSNACKYTDTGGAITLRTGIENGVVVVTVCDNGIGIPAEKLDGIFDLFVQVDTSLERSQGGLGIGLTLVKRLVEMHGGVVAARSGGAGQGSQFEVRLPLAEVPSATVVNVPAMQLRIEVPQRRVLVVDDNRDAADTLALSLNLLGHDTRTIYDPLLAMDALAEFGPDLAFLDVGMPKLNGLELAGMVRAAPNGDGIVLVALTGWGQDEDRRRSRLAGFDFHLVKPVDLTDIEQICSFQKSSLDRANAG